MATSDHLGLYLPTREDYISVKRDLSDNYEVIDEAIEALDNGIAIVVNGDNAPTNITSGQYLFIKNHSTLATGGYHATTNISSGAAVTSSNVVADSAGIVNALNSKIDNLDSGDITSLCTISTTNCANASVYKYGNIIIITGGTKSGVTGTNLTIVTVPYTLRRAYCYIGSYNTNVVGEGIIGAGSHDFKANISKSTDVGYFNIITEIVPS